MNRLVSIALLVSGVVLIIYGFNAANSVSSEVSKLFTGAPTDRALWMLFGGVVIAAIGAGGVLRRGK